MERVALVTGGARGIGRGIAAELARDHAVAITHNATDPGGITAEIPDLLSIRADLSEDAAPARIVEAVMERFGRIDVIVNNAAAISESSTAAPDQNANREMLQVNLLAPVALVAAALPHLGAGAAIVNISSVNAVFPPVSAPIYAASKAALETWTRALAKELGPRGIRVNAVSPGAIEREESPRPPDVLAQFLEVMALDRAGTPRDIAKAVRYLASDDAGFVTGAVLQVSGGFKL